MKPRTGGFRRPRQGYAPDVTGIPRTDGVGPGRERRATLTCYPDGPLLLRGEVDVYDASGVLVPRRRKTLALCRCGHSALAPLCDGTHKLVHGGTWRQRGDDHDDQPGTQGRTPDAPTAARSRDDRS